MKETASIRVEKIIDESSETEYVLFLANRPIAKGNIDEVTSSAMTIAILDKMGWLDIKETSRV